MWYFLAQRQILCGNWLSRGMSLSKMSASKPLPGSLQLLSTEFLYSGHSRFVASSNFGIKFCKVDKKNMPPESLTNALEKLSVSLTSETHVFSGLFWNQTLNFDLDSDQKLTTQFCRREWQLLEILKLLILIWFFYCCWDHTSSYFKKASTAMCFAKPPRVRGCPVGPGLELWRRKHSCVQLSIAEWAIGSTSNYYTPSKVVVFW